MLGFAVVGCGNISAAHIDSIEKLPDARLIAVWSRSAARAEKVAEKHGCAAYTDVEAMVQRSDVDVVTICTPSGAHLEPALAAARAGKHVIVEKPLEITLERCDRLIEGCDRAGVKLATVFNSRFAPGNQELLQAVRAGKFGRLVLGDAYVKWFRTQAYYEEGAWRGSWRWDGGGALMNQSIHQIDLLQWLMGPVEWVSGQTAMLAHEGIEVEDTAAAVLRFKSGALGVIEGTTSIYPGYPKRLELHGSRGSAVLVDDEIREWQYEGLAATERDALLDRYRPRQSSGTFADPMAMSFDKHRAQIAEMIEAIGQNRTPAVDGVEGRKSVEIILGVYRSAQTGQPVRLGAA